MNFARTLATLVTLCAFAFVLCACKAPAPSLTPRDDQTPTGVTSPHLSVYARSNVWFTNTFVLKPMGTDTNLAFTFAPLFVQELTLAETGSEEEIVFVAAGWLAEIHVSSDATIIKGRPRVRFTYFWQSPPRDLGNTSRQQALRITLSSEGHPVIWEVLDGANSTRVLHVAKSLETKAAAEFGKPLPGRSHSIEPALAVAPGLVVARVLDDSPVPMGPIVYIDAAAQIATVICRCMPAQASEVIGSRFYRLITAAEGISLTGFTDEPVQQLRLPSEW